MGGSFLTCVEHVCDDQIRSGLDLSEDMQLPNEKWQADP